MNDATWMNDSNREFIESRGYAVRNDGMIVLTKQQWQREQSIGYTGVSIRDNTTRTWMIPYCTLIFEGKHFVIE